MRQTHQRAITGRIVPFLAALLLAAACSAPLAAQQNESLVLTPALTSGRAVVCVTEHAILVAAISEGDAPASRQPVIVPIGSNYVGVLLGAVNWDSSDPATKLPRLEIELPRVAAGAARRIANPPPNQPSDIERMGIAILELLRPLVEGMHAKLNLAPGQPLFQLVLADYAEDYGPEVWSLEYRVQQDALRGDFWNSRIQRPAYHQLYPPEQGQPRTPVEIQYPKLAQPSLLDRIVRHDPAFDAIRGSSPEVAQGAAAYPTSMVKVEAGPVAKFLLAALPVAVGAKGRPAMALLDVRSGFQWVVPPAQPLPPPSQTPGKPQEPGAPTLRKYTPPE